MFTDLDIFDEFTGNNENPNENEGQGLPPNVVQPQNLNEPPNLNPNVPQDNLERNDDDMDLEDEGRNPNTGQGDHDNPQGENPPRIPDSLHSNDPNSQGDMNPVDDQQRENQNQNQLLDPLHFPSPVNNGRDDESISSNDPQEVPNYYENPDIKIFSDECIAESNPSKYFIL